MADNLFMSAPTVIETVAHSRMPSALREPRVNEWANANKRGDAIDSFIEGPAFDASGRLLVTDIPFGRVFHVEPGDRWTLIAQLDGWPNGMKATSDGTLLITDYRHGLVRLDPGTGKVSAALPHRQSESFKGVNDLCIARNGDVYFTDQGQTGMHDPTGRVFRWTGAHTQRPVRVDCLLDTVPSPNGLVLDPHEQVLFVAATRDNSVWRVPLFADGGTAKVGVFCRLFGASGPDGLAMDAQGRLYVAHASLGHVFVYSPRGELTHVIRSCAGQATTNLVFDPGDPRTVFITESDTATVLRAKLPF